MIGAAPSSCATSRPTSSPGECRPGSPRTRGLTGGSFARRSGRHAAVQHATSCAGVQHGVLRHDFVRRPDRARAPAVEPEDPIADPRERRHVVRHDDDGDACAPGIRACGPHTAAGIRHRRRPAPRPRAECPRRRSSRSRRRGGRSCRSNRSGAARRRTVRCRRTARSPSHSRLHVRPPQPQERAAQVHVRAPCSSMWNPAVSSMSGDTAPRIRSRPADGCSTRAITLRSVVLPAPLRPMMPSVSPRRTRSVRSSTARCSTVRRRFPLSNASLIVKCGIERQGGTGPTRRRAGSRCPRPTA